jgi:hypothetical protein
LPLHPEPTWRVRNVHTTASEQHGRDLPAERSVWNVDITVPAIVLGSRQTETEINIEACEKTNVEIVRRRSGGGMVFLSPGKQVWLDVVIPKNDPLFLATEHLAKSPPKDGYLFGHYGRTKYEAENLVREANGKRLSDGINARRLFLIEKQN